MVRWSGGTRWGTDASLAGVHSRVKHSSTSEAITSPCTVSTKGSVRRTAARPRSQVTISRLRSNRSTITPAAGPRKKPGTMRADITRPTAAAGEPWAMSAASAAMARKPSQSPVADATCVSQRWKNCDEPNNRTCNPGLSSGLPTAGDGSVGASCPTCSSPGSGTWRCSAIGSTLRVGRGSPAIRTLTAGRCAWRPSWRGPSPPSWPSSSRASCSAPSWHPCGPSWPGRRRGGSAAARRPARW